MSNAAMPTAAAGARNKTFMAGLVFKLTRQPPPSCARSQEPDLTLGSHAGGALKKTGPDAAVKRQIVPAVRIHPAVEAALGAPAFRRARNTAQYLICARAGVRQ